MSSVTDHPENDVRSALEAGRAAMEALDNRRAARIFSRLIEQRSAIPLDDGVAIAHGELARALALDSRYVPHGPFGESDSDLAGSIAHHFRTSLGHLLASGNLAEAIRVAKFRILGAYLTDHEHGLRHALVSQLDPVSPETAELLTCIAMSQVSSPIAERISLIDRSIAVASQLGDSVLEARAKANKAFLLEIHAERPEAIRLAREVIDTQHVHGDVEALGWAGMTLFVPSVIDGDHRAAERYARWAARSAREARSRFALVTCLRYLAVSEIGQGRLHDALESADEAESLSADRAFAYFIGQFTRFATNADWRHLDDAQSVFDGQIQSNGHMSLPACAAGFLALAGLFRPLPPERIEALWEFCEGTIGPDSPVDDPLTARNSRVRAARVTQALLTVQLDDRARASRYLDEVDRWLPGTPFVGAVDLSPWLSRQHLKGLLAWAAGDVVKAGKMLAQAVQGAASAGRLTDQLLSTLSQTRLLVQSGEYERSRQVGVRGSALATAVGFRAVAEEFEALLGSAGSGSATIGRRRLTARERDVLMRVALGYTNDRIAAELEISSYTVAEHLTRILRKTGCESRAEAAAFAVRIHLV